MKIIIKIMLVFWCCLATQAKAQVYKETTLTVAMTIQIGQYMIMDIEPNNLPIILRIRQTLEAGSPIVDVDKGNKYTFLKKEARDNTKWINFTSRLTYSSSAKIEATLDKTIPGLNLMLEVRGPKTKKGGKGELGYPTVSGPRVMTTSSQAIISGIGSSATGNGTGVGYRLVHSLEIADESLISKKSDKELKLTYTISND